MIRKTKKEPKRHQKEKVAERIVKKLVDNGFKAFWVGGCVRNLLLNLPPEDIDIATDAKPEEIIKIFKKTVKVGMEFGVVIVFLNGIKTEVATFRSDGEYIDHRHPKQIHFSTPRDDANRRDFTINGLFYDPIKKEILDFVKGKEDLKTGIIRAIGNPLERIEEDALRIMRAVRFAVRFNFKIEPKTFKAIQENAEFLRNISADRIRIELLKMLQGPRPGDAIKILEESGILLVILPEVSAMKGVSQPPEFHPEGDVFEHTYLALNLLEKQTPTLTMATLLHDVGKPQTFKVSDRIRFDLHNRVGSDMARSICVRLNFPHKQLRWIVSLVERHMDFLNIQNMRKSKLKRFLSSETIYEDIELHRVDCLASHGDTFNVDFCYKKIKEFESEESLNPTPLINGDSLIKVGYKPGPIFSSILTKVRDAQLEGIIKSEDEALSFVLKNFPLNNSNVSKE